MPTRKPAANPRPATRRYVVTVTKEDIAKAIPENSSTCAVARAIARTIPDTTRITVDTQAIRFSRGTRRFIYLTPPMAQKYVVDFDAGNPIDPFAFRLDEANLLPMKQQVLTAAGREADRLAFRAGQVAARAAKAQGKDPRAAAKEARRVTRRRVRQTQTEPPKTQRPGRTAAPQVFRAKKRSYGHRLLRINQAGMSILTGAVPAARENP